MFRLILFSLSSLLFIALSVKADVNYETWYCPSWPCPTSSNTLLSSGTLSDSTMNYDWGSGVVLDSGRSDYVVVHLDGYITVPIPSNGSAGDSVTVTFYNQDDDGSLLKIDGTTVIDDWSGLHAPATRTGTITLQAGETYTYERWFSEWSGGAVLRQLWYVPNATAGAVYVNASTDISTTAPVQAPTPSYSSGPTSAQQTRINSAISNATTSGEGSKVDVDVTGNDNTIYIDQAGEPSYLLLDVIGNTNIVDIDQDATGTTGYGHYSEVLIDGDRNDLDLLQSGAGNKTAFVDIDGDDNILDIIQRDGGSHYLQLDLIGDDHDVDVTQEGSGGHAATIELTNSGGGWDFDLTQSGTTDKTYSLPHSMSDGSTTSGTCYNVSGCSLSVTQGD